MLTLGWLAGSAAAQESASTPRLAPEQKARFADGIEALRTGDWRAAVWGFRALITQPLLLSDYARLLLAESLSRTGALAEARRTAEALAGASPRSQVAPSALLRAATLASEQGDERGAEELFRRFLAWFPDSPDGARVRYLLGLTVESQGRAQEAALIFRELWLSSPAGPYGEAAGDKLDELLQGGVVLPPLTFQERLKRAERLVHGGAAEEALEGAEAILRENPGEDLALRALLVMASALRRLGRYREAAGTMGRALGLAPPDRRAQLLLELGRLQWRARAPKRALATVNRVPEGLSESGLAAQALLLKGQLLEGLGRTAEAVRSYRRVAVRFPDDPAASRALWQMGWIAYLGSDFAGAAREFGQLVEAPASTGFQLAGRYWAGRSLERLGKPREALRLFRSLLAGAPRSYYGILAARRYKIAPGSVPKPLPVRLPTDPRTPLANQVHFARAEALRALGLVDHAERELEELSRKVFADPQKLYGVATAFVRHERYHLALRILRESFTDFAWSGHSQLPQQFWTAFYPFGWESEIREVARRKALEPYLVAAVVREESGFDPLARSPVGAGGLMQLMPQTARSLAVRAGVAVDADELLYEPERNLELGAAFLASLVKEFSDPSLAIAAYNAGPARVRQWWAARPSDDLEIFVEQIPFTETRRFTKRVLASWEEYRRIYGVKR
ncbi:MAG: transglycosylase SLT domain-containing protein [Candidatus Methylomirabilia bacterium]